MPAIAVCQQHFQWLACRLRGQARSHIFGPWRLWSSDSAWIWMPIAPEPMTAMDVTGVALTPVGAGLLANAVGQSNHQRLTRRLRGQARSHIFGPWRLWPSDSSWIWMPIAPEPMMGMDFTGVALTPVGAWRLWSSDSSWIWMPIAQEPMTIMSCEFSRPTKFFPACANPCGSGLARERGGSVKSPVTDTPPSRASPLPQGLFSVEEICFPAIPHGSFPRYRVGRCLRRIHRDRS